MKIITRKMLVDDEGEAVILMGRKGFSYRNSILSPNDNGGQSFRYHYGIDYAGNLMVVAEAASRPFTK